MQVVFGRLFLQHYMAVLNYSGSGLTNTSGYNGTLDLYPKKYSIENDFLVSQDDQD